MARFNFKKSLKLITTTFLFLFGTLILNVPAAHADPLGQITGYQSTPVLHKPWGIAQDTEGKLWLTQNFAQTISKFDPITLQFTHYPLPTSPSGVFGSPGYIVSAPDGTLWFSMSSNYIGRITKGGQITSYNLNSPTNDLTVGPDGRIWAGGLNTNKIFRLNLDGTIHSVIITNDDVRNITSDPAHDLIWFTSEEYHFPTPSGWLGRINMQGQKTEYAHSETLGSITVDASGKPWMLAPSKVGYWENNQFSWFNLPNYGAILRTDLAGNLWTTSFNGGSVMRITSSGSVTQYYPQWTNGNPRPNGLVAGSDGNMWFTEYDGRKISKIGTGANGLNDADGDGLNANLELQQGTVDNDTDADNDGLNDYVESTWYVNKNATFCKSDLSACAYPSPLQKDVYVEMDWMPGKQPTPTQLAPITTAFANKNVRAHFDIGQYGGGNEVTNNALIAFQPTANYPDFSDYKFGGDGINAQFDETNRYHIWHYTIFGNSYSESPGSSGVSYVGDDDFFIASSVIADLSQTYGLNFDTALAGTTIHELGHNLCFSNPIFDYQTHYPTQPADCRYSGIDASGGSSYMSSLNYDKQFTLVDYSTGANGSPNDHNDWGALRLQDFTLSSQGDPQPGAKSNDKTKRNKGQLIKNKAHERLKASKIRS